MRKVEMSSLHDGPVLHNSGMILGVDLSGTSGVRADGVYRVVVAVVVPSRIVVPVRFPGRPGMEVRA